MKDTHLPSTDRETEEPYVAARREWNERYGEYIARARRPAKRCIRGSSLVRQFSPASVSYGLPRRASLSFHTWLRSINCGDALAVQGLTARPQRTARGEGHNCRSGSPGVRAVSQTRWHGEASPFQEEISIWRREAPPTFSTV